MAQKWITKKGNDGKNRHIPINERNKMREREVKIPKLDNISIQEHNWGMEYLGNGHWELRLGNLSDAGWYWTGDENDMLGFLIRINNDKRYWPEFLEAMKRYGISFDDLKTILLKNLKHNDGLYEISGDNSTWEGYELDDDFTMELHDAMLDDERINELTDEQKDDLEDMVYDYVNTSYENFEKEYGDEYKKLMKKAIDNSNSFNRFNEELDSVFEEINEMYRQFISDEVYNGLEKAINEFKNKGE